MIKPTPSKPAVLVTGAGQRIGAAIATHLSAQGFDVALHYNRSKAQAQKVRQQILSQNSDCMLFKADLSNEKETQKLIESVQQKYKNLNLIINNASVFNLSSLLKSNYADFDQTIAIHLKAPYILTCAFARKCKKGQVINILDTHITRNQTHYFNYLLSKKALLNLTQMAAVSLAPKIRVNAIAPGLIMPPKGKNKLHLTRLAKDIPLKRVGTLHNILQSIDFLITNDYMTGQILFNDGGEHLL